MSYHSELHHGYNMTKLVFVYLCITLVKIFSVASSSPKCGPSETLNTCPRNCGTQYCPERENYDRSCPNSDTSNCAPSACECQFNYKRAKNGTCIPTVACPKFYCSGRNEEYVPCPQSCPTDDCSQATPDGRCPYSSLGFMLFVVECEPACRCIKGYWRNNGICVPYDQCPKS